MGLSIGLIFFLISKLVFFGREYSAPGTRSLRKKNGSPIQWHVSKGVASVREKDEIQNQPCRPGQQSYASVRRGKAQLALPLRRWRRYHGGTIVF